MHLDGYMSHFHFIDGTAICKHPTLVKLIPTVSGPRIPSPSVTYGTNGFFLKFANSGSLGTDSSGNGNNFTKSGSGDQVTDTPDNVFATWNSVLYTSGGVTYSEGNTRIATNDATKLGSATTLGASTGKWYCEMKIPGNAPASLNGVSYNPQEALRNAYHSGYLASSWGYYGSTGQVYNNNSASSYGNALVNNDILMIAMDLDNSKLYFGINGTWQNSGDPTSGATGTGAVSIDSGQTYFFEGGDAGSGVSTNIQLNTGNPTFTISSGNTDDNGYGNFEYAPPTGYLALCTKNLAETLTLPIGGGTDYFNTVLYTGNGGTKAVTGVGFASDFVWVKERSSTSAHRLADTTRGATKSLSTSSNGGTEAELTNSDILASFDSDGFTVGANNGVNESDVTYASWNWKANGGTTSSNTDGSITSTVQANTTAGFSVVTYTGTGSQATVGHGLGKTPKMIIWKRRDGSSNWSVQGTQSGINTDQTEIVLNSTGAVSGVDSRLSRQSQWSSTTFEVNTYTDQNASGGTYVAYCFAGIEGYSKFGSYTGNGSSDGPFVYTGFRPAWILRKSSSNAEVWSILDSTRSPINYAQDVLRANASNAEGSATWSTIDILSNGFKMRATDPSTNGSGATYIYMAFAENPFVDSTGRPVTAR